MTEEQAEQIIALLQTMSKQLDEISSDTGTISTNSYDLGDLDEIKKTVNSINASI